MLRCAMGLAMMVAATVHAGDQPPVDEDVDFLLKKAATAPATRPATLPSAASPLDNKAAPQDRRQGLLTLSNGEKIRGRFFTTLEKPLRVFDAQKKAYIDVPFSLIKSIEAKVVWERDEKEWRFRESGSDIKEFTGKTYPARETEYTFTLLNDQTIAGPVAAPIHLELPEGQSKTFVLHKRDKAEVGKSLKELVYIRKVEFVEKE